MISSAQNLMFSNSKTSNLSPNVLFPFRHHHSTNLSLLRIGLKTRFCTKNQLRQKAVVKRRVSAEQLCKYEQFKLFTSVTLFCSRRREPRLVIGKALGLLAQADLATQLLQCLQVVRVIKQAAVEPNYTTQCCATGRILDQAILAYHKHSCFSISPRSFPLFFNSLVIQLRDVSSEMGSLT